MLRPGTTIGDRYAIEGVLARGGVVDVYRATDRATGRSVAVEALRSGAADPRRFAIETRLLATLEHRNLVRLLDAGHDAGLPYLVVELVDGDTLAHWLEGGPLAPLVTARVGRDIAGALSYLHAHGVVHGDVTPSSIVLVDGGRAVLSDVATAGLSDASLAATGSAPGNAAYLAPEQVSGAEVGPPADIYSLGLVLIEALTGRPAFVGPPDELVAKRLSDGPEVAAELPDPWPVLLARMTRRDPAARPEAATVGAYLRPSRMPSAAIAAAPLDDTVTPATAATTGTAGTPVVDAAALDDTVVMHIPVTDDAREAEAADLTSSAATDLRARHRPPAQSREPESGDPVVRPALFLLAALAALLVVGLVVAFDAVREDRHDASLDPAPSLTTTSSFPRSVTTTTGLSPSSATATSAAPSTTATTLATTAPSTTVVVQGESAAGAQSEACAALQARSQELDAARRDVNVTYRHDRATRDHMKALIDADQQAVVAEMQSLGC